MIIDLLEKRIEFVHSALSQSESEWAKTYWEVVLVYLLRQANRLN